MESAGSAMRPRISLFSRCSLLLIALCAAQVGDITSTRANRSPASPGGALASSKFMIEVRLRKLHLARPDLIPYPIETEVYC
jgi:hypothetical protein